MNRDRVEGSLKQAKNSLKEAISRATGNRRSPAKESVVKAEGKIQKDVLR